MSRIFISYRRHDSESTTFLLVDHIVARFGKEMVFFDLGSIEPGEDFTKIMRSRLGSCEIFVVVIGKNAFLRRQPQDLADADWFVSEIEEALRRGVPVVPVLVNGAKPLAASKLPHQIRTLANIQALAISSTHFDYDITRLVGVLEKRLTSTKWVISSKAADAIQPTPDQWYYVMSRGTNLAIDVADESRDDGASACLWNAPGGVENQLWKFILGNGGYYHVVAKHSGECLVCESKTLDGSLLVQHPWSGAPNQEWRVEPAATGSYRLIARHSGLCLDRDFLSFGTRVRRWVFEPPSFFSEGGNRLLAASMR